VGYEFKKKEKKEKEKTKKEQPVSALGLRRARL
jgi:hypothetical protein